MNDIKALYARWKERATLDPDLAMELNEIAGDEDAILDRFFKNLEFGTGGLRGVIGAGTNRMNVYTSISIRNSCPPRCFRSRCAISTARAALS